MTDLVRTELDGRVLRLTLARPEKLNALTQDMYAALADGLERAAAEAEVRVVVVTGEGETFTAGNDLKDFAAGPRGDGPPPVIRFLQAVRDCPKPVIAAVNGPAVGVGLTMLLHCDLAFAAETATFRAPFAQIGLVPEAGSSLLLPQALGLAWANDLLIAGRVLTAAEALSAGLVSRVYAPKTLAKETARTAASVAAQAPEATRLTKALIRSQREAVAERMEREGELFAARLRSAEFMEAAAAFMHKRAPDFG
ncbi:MAG: enoyl-CoA hydratase-related protein [Pseudomonadota bacterium]